MRAIRWNMRSRSLRHRAQSEPELKGGLELDARNPTAYGTLRAFVRVDVAFRTGAARSGSAFRTGYAFDAGAANNSGWVNRAQTHVLIEKAFVQWGGLVAGKTTSLFEYNKSTQFIGVLASSNLTNQVNLLGYIATFDSRLLCKPVARGSNHPAHRVD